MPTAVEEQALSAHEVAAIRQQLEALVQDDLFRSSRRSVSFLRYIVEETLLGNGESLKERTIGVNVFGKALTYDTNLDHVVRTAASELRKRLALYYGREDHRKELRISLVPGSYIPHFIPVAPEIAAPVSNLATNDLSQTDSNDSSSGRLTRMQSPGIPPSTSRRYRFVLYLLLVLLVAALMAGLRWGKSQPTMQQMFWKPLVSSNGSVLIAVGDVPNGPPITSVDSATTPAPTRVSSGPPSIPFADAVTIARLSAILSAQGKDFVIRRETSSSFADFRERPVVLVGAFNNDWSLRLTRGLRFSLAMDPARRVIFIRDRDHPDARDWEWGIDPHPEEKARGSNRPLHDYALISRTLDGDTGHDVIVIGGLYIYGTQAAGEFLADPQMAPLERDVLLRQKPKTLQIVLETLVTDGTAGIPRIVAVWAE
jgi:hypothetical protein